MPLAICNEQQLELVPEASPEIVDTPSVTVCRHEDVKVDDLATKVVGYCTSHNIEDPVEIL